MAMGHGADREPSRIRVSRPADREETQARALGERVARGAEGPAGTPPLPAAGAMATVGGAALPAPTRAYFERRLQGDLSRTRLHAGPGAAALAAAFGARALTLGDHIYFGRGRLAPGSPTGLRLLTHELAHAVEPDRHGTARLDPDSDFQGRIPVRVADAPTRPPGTIRINNAAGEAVYAPYGIYWLSEIPERYYDLEMQSGMGWQMRNPDLPMGEAAAREAASPRAGRLSLRELVGFFGRAGPQQRVRVMLASVDGGLRLVGYDQSRTDPRLISGGYVESEVGTGAVGRILFGDRVTRALGEGVPNMLVEVGLSQRTADFHAEIYRVIGRSGRPSQGEHYQLDTREMVRIALSWSDALTGEQRYQLAPLAAGREAPNPSTVQRVLAVRSTETRPSGPGAPPGPGPAGAPSGETMAMMRRMLEEMRSNVRRPAEVATLRELQDPEVQERILSGHAGFAVSGSRLYRLQRVGNMVRILEVAPQPIVTPVAGASGAGPAPGAGSEAGGGPPVLNLDPAGRSVRVGEAEIPPSAVPRAELRAGELVVVGYDRAVEVRDPATGRPLLGLYEGGRWYRVLGPGDHPMGFDPVTGQRVVELRLEGGPVRAMEVPTEPALPRPTTLQRAPGASIAVGIGGAIMVANEILAPIGAALQNQRATIARGHVEIDLWTALGANPTTGLWDVHGQAPAAPGTRADTAVFGTWYFPYVADIDANALRAALVRRVGSYVELQTLLASMRSLGAFQEEEGRTYAVVNRPHRGNRRVYDITEALRTIEAATLAAEDDRLRERLAARPQAERRGRIFRIHPGARLFRAQPNRRYGQPLVGAGDRLGAQALVREIRRTDYSLSTNLIFVEPVNSDAYRAVARASYWIPNPIEEVWQECRDGGRAVTPASLPSFSQGPLDSFTADPETGGDRRFGVTSYVRHPENPGQWTMATGELNAFWVSVADVDQLSESEVETFS